MIRDDPEIVQAAEELDFFAGVADFPVDLGPLGGGFCTVPGNPLYTVEGVNVKQAVQVVQLSGSVQVVKRVIERLARLDQLGLDEFIEHVGADHVAEIALPYVITDRKLLFQPTAEI